LGRKVDRHLPRGRNTLNLYEVTMAEKLYSENYGVLQENFSDPSIEGVYETKVELLFRAIMKLGCVCSVTKEARSRRVKVKIKLPFLIPNRLLPFIGKCVKRRL